MKVGELSERDARERMAHQGLALRIPPITVRLRSTIASLSTEIRDLYRDYALADSAAFADVDVRLLAMRGGVQFLVDGTMPFDTLPLTQAVPMFEWGLNSVFAHRTHDYLLLHAAVVERGGVAVLLPAWPGSGKSTLAASLACRGWRYLSDEFGVLAFSGTHVVPFARPAGLKNESIEIVRSIGPQGCVGRSAAGTHKGTVAYFRVPEESIARGSDGARVGAVVYPEFKSGASMTVARVGKAAAFLRLAGNSFNYEIFGGRGFDALAALVRACDGYSLRYGSLADAHDALDEIVMRAMHTAAN
jgi:HprK-related kinase A